MQDKHEYLPISSSQKKFGLYITCAGHHQIKPEAKFPPDGHPDKYYFTWKKGRHLDEWQIIILEDGEGEVEFEDHKQKLSRGGVIILPPNRWHRYRPNVKTGWTSRWIGFGGDIADRFLGLIGLSSKGFIRYIDLNSDTKAIFDSIIDTLILHPERNVLSTAVDVLKLLTSVIENSGTDKRDANGENPIAKAQSYIIAYNSETIDFEELAHTLHQNYRTFRYRFRQETGMSPLQYQLARRMDCARNLLASSDLTIKTIAKHLGFASTWYFSRFFTKHNGVSPIRFRSRLRNN